MSKTTRATQALAKAGVPFAVLTYEYDADAASVGLHAAESLGLPPARVFKTLLAQVDGRPVCAVVPSDREVNMKRLAAAFGGKHAEMMKPADAERLSGYHVGGISPFGMKKRTPVAIEELAFAHEKIVMNGGGRGVQVELAPTDAERVLGAKRATVVA